MKTRNIYVNEKDKQRLKKLFASTIGFRSADLKVVKDLLNELDRAVVLTEENINGNIITMNSTARVKDMDSGREYMYTLVYPEFADINENKISILAPIGTALLGYKEGDVIEWPVPKGKRRLKVIEVTFQPEAADKMNTV